jgi:hypothetical protein
MMKSLLDSARHEGQNLRNLLLWKQEVFLMPVSAVWGVQREDAPLRYSLSPMIGGSKGVKNISSMLSEGSMR